MVTETPSAIRVYTPASEPVSPQILAAQELLRPPCEGPGDRDIEPFTRGWFEQIELTRYSRAGTWMPRLLEFSRHGSDSLVMIGPGLGTDAIQYDRHGTAVTIAIRPVDSIEYIKKNIEIHGRSIEMIPAAGETALPFSRGAFDLAYVNALHNVTSEPASIFDEIYRVLKPGGKVFGLFPACFDVDFWRRLLHPCPRWYFDPPARPTSSQTHTAGELRASLQRFTEIRISKRHLRRAELPPSWRFLPHTLLERLIGRVLVVRAFKPISAVREELAAA